MRKWNIDSDDVNVNVNNPLREHRMWRAIRTNVRHDNICEHIYNLIEIVCHLPQIDGAKRARK